MEQHYETIIKELIAMAEDILKIEPLTSDNLGKASKALGEARDYQSRLEIMKRKNTKI